MWTLACDNGHLDDDEVELKIRLLPADNVEVNDLLNEIQDLGMITRDNGVITIPNLIKHQKIDRRWFKTCDLVTCEKPNLDNNTTSTRRGHDVDSTRTRLAPDADIDIDSDIEGDSEIDSDVELSKKQINILFESFWSAFPSDRKGAKPQCAQKFERAIKNGIDPQVIISAAERYRDDPNREPEFTVSPRRWLNEERWESGPLPARSNNADRSLQALQRDRARLQATGTQPTLQIASEPYPWENQS